MRKVLVTAASTFLVHPHCIYSFNGHIPKTKVIHLQNFFGNKSREFGLFPKKARWVSLLQVHSSSSSSHFSETEMISIPNSSLLLEYNHVSSIDSTQDEARRILEGRDNDNDLKIAVSAAEQTLGRGTNGRNWIGNKGNMFLTIAFPFDCLPVPVTLLPLKVGSIIAAEVRKVLGKESHRVSLKWPNDTLIDEMKVGGVLIETYSNEKNEMFFLVGIGINIVVAPEIPSSGSERGRTATCIYEYLSEDQKSFSAKTLSKNISTNMFDWIEHDSSLSKSVAGEKVVEEWEKYVNNWGKKLILRDKGNGFDTVIPLGIEKDGQLRVRDKFGKESLLCADYLL